MVESGERCEVKKSPLSERLEQANRRVKHLSFVVIGLDQNYSAYYNWGHTIDISQKLIIGIYRFIYRFF